jgi:rare lipoprotein A
MLKKQLILLTAISTLGMATLPQPPAKASDQCGYASHYGLGDGYGGQKTANGEIMNPYAMTAAHPYLRLGTEIEVTDQNTNKKIIVRINDRGPYASGRILDLSYGAFSQIRNPQRGETYVCYAIISRHRSKYVS